MSGKRLNEVIDRSKRNGHHKERVICKGDDGNSINKRFQQGGDIDNNFDIGYLKKTYKCDKKHGRHGLIQTASDADDKEYQVKNWKEYLELARKSYDERRLKSSVSVRKQDFQFIKTLGVGAFGRVMLARFTSDGNYYAAKLMSKSILVKDKHVQHARNEKQILQGIRFPFTIHLEYFVQDNVYIYYIMPLISGGELFAYLTKVSRFKEEVARFYCAQICLALEYIHYLGLIFRDLKPENVLIDNKGFLKLADFGFCKALKDRTYTFCGTAEYLAPEMILCKGYGKSVDWWTFGIFTFELCSGYTPFYSKLAAKTYDNISKCKYKMPFFFSNDLRDFIKNMLVLDLSKRYGNLRNGVDDIKEHKWFSGLPWTMLVNRQIKPPYVPIINRPDDTRNFDPQFEEPLEESPIDLYHTDFSNF